MALRFKMTAFKTEKEGYFMDFVYKNTLRKKCTISAINKKNIFVLILNKMNLI